jgi:hypothetical protein
MHELYILKEVLEQLLAPAGFVLTEEWCSEEFPGSSFVRFTRPGDEVRLVWDDRDGCAFLEHRHPREASWQRVGTPIGEGRTDEMKARALEVWQTALAPILL